MTDSTIPFANRAAINKLTENIIGACIEVHRHLGPGLLESAYEECLAYELDVRGCLVDRQRPLPLIYKEINLDCGYRLDLVVDELVIVEVKAVDALQPIHNAQLLSYLRLTGLTVGLLANFHVPLMRSGIRRIVHDLSENEPSATPRLRGERDNST